MTKIKINDLVKIKKTFRIGKVIKINRLVTKCKVKFINGIDGEIWIPIKKLTRIGVNIKKK